MSDNNSESEIETVFEKKIYGVQDVVNAQTNLILKLQKLIVNDYNKSRKVLEHGNEITDEAQTEKMQVSAEFEHFLNRTRKELVRNYETMHLKVNSFGKELRDVLKVYTDVQKRMKSEEKQKLEVAHHMFIEHVEKNSVELKDLKANIVKLQTLFNPQLPPIPSATSKFRQNPSDYLVQSNHIQKPFKPIETELVTHMTRIIQELYLLRENLQACPHIVKLTEPIIAQSKRVAEMILKEYPARALEDFLKTLPADQREG
ncbi:unnamed protein product [Caenorhabditis sp. 36 PRJEB53466]|nr:unnamed protein product [Caenorhabditis sp. 36 PRJEB53466]